MLAVADIAMETPSRRCHRTLAPRIQEQVQMLPAAPRASIVSGSPCAVRRMAVGFNRLTRILV
jgi:hypothetical protein